MNGFQFSVFGANGPSLAEVLGFTPWPTPCEATLSNRFLLQSTKKYRTRSANRGVE